MGQAVAELLAQIFKIPLPSVRDDLALREIDAWDSLKHMEMIIIFEQTYAIEFSFDEIVAMQTVASVKQILENKGIKA
jgi:acyl carrier protein